jgi:hypothetical protein
MALNTLTVTVSSGVIGRPFVTAVNGLTAGSIVEIAEGGATGFGYSNGKLSHRALPYDTQLVILRERLTATGESKLTFLIVTAVGAYAIAQQAAGMSATARNVRVGGVVQNDGSVVSTLFVEDATGALISAAVGGAVVVTLGPLTLSDTNFVVGTGKTVNILGSAAGSAITISTGVTGFSIDSTALTVTYNGSGSAGTPSLGLTETLAGAVGSPKVTSIALLLSAAAVTLNTLSLSGTLQIGTATSGTIIGATPGSAIVGNIPGITVNSAARTYSGTPTGSAATISNGLVETLAGATNTPLSSSVTVAASGAASFAQPYGPYYSDFGDSRTVQDNGTSGSATYIGTFTDNKLRPSPTWGNGGIGGQNSVQAASWPRPIGGAGWTATFVGNGDGTSNMTIKATVGGDSIGIGRLLTFTGAPANCKILSLVSGSMGAINSVVKISGDTGTLAVRPFQAYYVDTKTVAELASDIAASVVILLGTNNNGAPTETAAVKQIVTGLTTPGSPYPGYRPNGEATDQPLPLYGGLAKNIILYDELRKGEDWSGTAGHPSATDSTPMHTHALELQKLHWNSGDGLANPRVYVARIFDDPTIADLTSATSGNPSFLPQKGWLVGGLHFTNALAFQCGKIIGLGNTADGITEPGLKSLLTLPSNTVLADTTNASGNTFMNADPCFVNQGGGLGTGSFAGAGGGVLATGNSSIPTGFRLDGAGCGGLTMEITYTLLAGTDGYECDLYLHGTPATDGSFSLFGSSATSAKRLLIQATDIIRLACRERRQINSGRIHSARWNIQYPNSSSGGVTPGHGGLYSGTDRTTMMLLNNIQDSGNAAAVANSSTYFIPQTADYSGTANPSTVAGYYKVEWYTGQDIDAHFKLSRYSISRN